MDYQYSIPTYNMGTDLYRAHMSDDAFHWGHNQARTGAGHMNMDYITFNLNPTNHAQYREVAEQYLHWMHGVNPMGMVMLSNMYNYGAEKCANEIYHTWFTHNSIWDNSLTSPNGPAPGYVPGGPNKSYTGSVSGITNQPPQKAYKDWNTGFPENSWEITEPSIYCQASYVMLLARLMPATGTPPPPTDTVPPTTPLNLVISNVTETGLTLSWYASTDNIGVTGYEVYQGTVLLNGNVATTSYQVSGLTCATSYSFTVKAKDAAGNVSSPSDAANATTSTCIILTTKVIYDDVTGVDWSDVSTGSTRNFTNSNPVKAGIRSIRVDYLGSGTLSFLKGTAVNTAPTTQLRFWVYNTENNSIRIFTEASDNGGQSSEVTVRPSRKKWVEVVVTMAQLGNPAVIKKVTIQNAATSSTTMYFDDIRLVNVSDPEPQPRAAVTGAAELKQEVHWSVYPNPASDVLIVTMNTHESRSTAELIDAGGRSVLRKEINTIEGVNKLSIPLPPLVPGVYYFRIITATGGKAVPIMVK